MFLEKLQNPLRQHSTLLFLLIGFICWGIGENSTATNLALPTPSEFANQFKSTQNENQRFQLFNDLDARAEEIGDSKEVKEYLGTILEMMKYSLSLNDSSWVSGKGKELRQKISGNRIAKYINRVNLPLHN